MKNGGLYVTYIDSGLLVVSREICFQFLSIFSVCQPVIINISKMTAEYCIVNEIARADEIDL